MNSFDLKCEDITLHIEYRIEGKFGMGQFGELTLNNNNNPLL